MNKRMFLPLVATVLLVLFAGCKKDDLKVSKTFGAKIEPPAGEAKTYLVNEKWIYWDADDRISVLGTKDPAGLIEGSIVSGANSTMGFFRAEGLENGSSDYVFLFPHNTNNYIDISNRDVKVFFPETQAFRDDLTFGKEACPMVGYVHENDDSVLFHSVAGLARLQLYSSAGDKDISSITFQEVSETPQQISGKFKVNDYTEYDPYLSGTTVTAQTRQIVIPCNSGERVVGSSNGDLCTFYLVLPAMDETKIYKLQMTVTTTDGKQFQKTFGVKVRRNSIMKVPALNITSWSDAPGAGTADISIVGNGTELRPFQIYTVAELQKVRDAMNAEGTRTLNGQVITASSQFALMRSDIVLDNSNWTSGIQNFVGHFYYAGASSVATPGITNGSKIPIFTSIAAGGVVEGLTLKGTFSNNADLTTSPLCGENKGVIKNCRTALGSSFTLVSSNASAGIAGICVDNEGTIIGCSHQGTLTCNNGTAAGICLNNKSTGVIANCFVISPAKLVAKMMGGIVYYNNEGLVRASYFASNMTSVSGKLGCIVYSNRGKIQSCMLQTSASLKSQNALGGVVYINIAGVVDSCYCNASVFEGKELLGGIIAEMQGGEVRNSYFNAGTTNIKFTGNGYCGGFVGHMNGGEIKNCYVRAKMQAAAATYGGFVGLLEAGTIENVYCQIYNTGDRFFGTNSSGTLTRCYNYGRTSQSDVTSYTDASNIGGSTLSALLNSWVSSAGGSYRHWTSSATPTLK